MKGKKGARGAEKRQGRKRDKSEQVLIGQRPGSERQRVPVVTARAEV